MCFVLGHLASDPNPELTLVSNRDEFYGRQGTFPERHSEGPRAFVAPIDPREGGSWFGLNEDGLLVALTNRLDARPYDDAPSRGQLVRKILSHASSRSEARDRYRSLEPGRYNPHRILFLDSGGVTVFRQMPEGGERTDASPGVFYLDNHSGLITDSTRVSEQLPEAVDALREFNREELETFCAGHDPFFERESACLHLEEVAGTLSSSVLRINPASETVQYRFVQGQPCENAFQDVSLDDSLRSSILDGWISTNDRR